MKKKILILTLLIILTIIPFMICHGDLPITFFSPVPAAPMEETQPSWSPDGKKLAYVCYVKGPVTFLSRFDIMLEGPTATIEPWSQFTFEAADICVVDLITGNWWQLTRDLGTDWHPIWSPDGIQIAYLGANGIYVTDFNGIDKHIVVQLDKPQLDQLSWSPDGTKLLFSKCDSTGYRNIYIVEINGAVITRLTSNNQNNFNPQWNSNNKIIFLSTSSTDSVCIVNYDGPHVIKTMDISNKAEQSISTPAYYAFLAGLSTGDVIFSTNPEAKTESQYLTSKRFQRIEYKINVSHTKLLTIPVTNSLIPLGELEMDSVSPNGNYLVYKNVFDWTRLQIFNLNTQIITQPLAIESLFKNENRYAGNIPFDTPHDSTLTNWSPDNKKLAFTAYLYQGLEDFGYYQRHIYIYDLEKNVVYPIIR